MRQACGAFMQMS